MYAIIKSINGNFFVDSEGMTKETAIIQWHNVCRTLWNASDVKTACVAIVNENLFTVENYIENIIHETITTN